MHTLKKNWRADRKHSRCGANDKGERITTITTKDKQLIYLSYLVLFLLGLEKAHMRRSPFSRIQSTYVGDISFGDDDPSTFRFV